METGIVFDIKEFTVHDGPGIRTTVFMKGCPLRCQWCHNPEGLSPEPEVMVSAACIHCGRCEDASCSLRQQGSCSACGKCLPLCPYGYRKIAGQEYSSRELSEQIMKNAAFLDKGGVTFSGGEPLLQNAFLKEVLQDLPVHRAIQTSGYCDPGVFQDVLQYVDYLLFDLKLVNGEVHKRYTGVDNAAILQNLNTLMDSELPFVLRIPLIKGVNNTRENLSQSAELVRNTQGMERVELLPYNAAAPAKYKMVRRSFPYDFQPPEQIDTSVFTARGIEVVVL